jgi:hypothetical protein
MYGFTAGVFRPTPTAPIPIMIGGMSEPALRRIAALGDQWQAVGIGPEEFAEKAAQLRKNAVRPLTLGARIGWPELPADPAAEIAAWEAAGADQLAIWFGDVDGFGERMHAARAARG